MFPENDDEFHEVRIKSVVDDSSGLRVITGEDGWSLGLPAEPKVPIQQGAIARLYGRGIGYPVRGVFVDGERVFYSTREEEEAKHKEQRELAERDAREKYMQGAPERAVRIAALPTAFRERLSRFQRNRPETSWRNEDYEIFVCEEAVKIARHMDAVPDVREPIKAFREYVEAHEAEFGISDQHSGNTFGAAVLLAFFWLRPDDGEELVSKAHAAICPLLGCEDCGCFAVEKAA